MSPYVYVVACAFGFGYLGCTPYRLLDDPDREKYLVSDIRLAQSYEHSEDEDTVYKA